jgi:hypothetical protein
MIVNANEERPETASMMPLRLITGHILSNHARVQKNAYASSALARS